MTSQNSSIFRSIEMCLFCGSRDHEIKITSVEDYYFGTDFGAHDFAQCQHCDSLWSTTQIKEEHIDKAYAVYYTHEAVIEPKFDLSLRSKIIQGYISARFGGDSSVSSTASMWLWQSMAKDPENVDWQLRFVPKAPAKILDFGCGNGHYISRLKQLGYEVYGIEPDPKAVEAAQELGLNVCTPDEAKGIFGNSTLDAITINHVIEHVPDPIETLQYFHSLLKPGGMIYIEAPNALASGLSVFGKYWRGLEAPRHFSIPSVKGLKKALSYTGFVFDRQIIPRKARLEVWPKSLEPIPHDLRSQYELKLSDVGVENLSNAEFIGIIAHKQ